MRHMDNLCEVIVAAYYVETTMKDLQLNDFADRKSEPELVMVARML